MQGMRLTILNGERWTSAASSLLFGVHARKIEFWSAPRQVRAPRPSAPTVLYSACVCCSVLVNRCRCLDLIWMLFVLIYFTLCVLIKLPIFLKFFFGFEGFHCILYYLSLSIQWTIIFIDVFLENTTIVKLYELKKGFVCKIVWLPINSYPL